MLVLAVSESGRVVLTRDSRFPPGKWGLVAGYVERDETVEEAALRELREEAGLQGKAPRLVATFASGENLLLCVHCVVADGAVTRDGHTDMERSMATEVELAEPDLTRMAPDSSALRLLERFLSGALPSRSEGA